MIELTDATWRKSTRSNDTQNCVEVAENLPGMTAVRDSKDPAGPALAFTLGEWTAFVDGIKDGEFDL